MKPQGWLRTGRWEPLCSLHCTCGLWNKSQMDKQRGTEPTQLQAFQLCSRCRMPECGILLRNILSSVSAWCAGSPACTQPLTLSGKPSPGSWNPCSASCEAGMLRALPRGGQQDTLPAPGTAPAEWNKSRGNPESAGTGSPAGTQLSAAAVVQPPFWNVPFHPSLWPPLEPSEIPSSREALCSYRHSDGLS